MGELVAEPPSRGSRRFPELCINLRNGSRSSQIFLPPAAQIATASAVLAVAIAVCHVAVSRIDYERAAAEREAAVVRAEMANADLQDEVANLRDELALAARDRQQATADLDRALGDRDRLRARIAALEQEPSQLDVAHRQKWTGVFRLAGLIETEPSQSAASPPRPEILISDAPLETEAQSPTVAQLARQAVAEVRRLLASDRSECGPSISAIGPRPRRPRRSLRGAAESRSAERDNSGQDGGAPQFYEVAAVLGAARLLSAREPLRPAPRSVQSSVVLSHRDRSVGALHVPGSCHCIGDRDLRRQSQRLR